MNAKGSLSQGLGRGHGPNLPLEGRGGSLVWASHMCGGAGEKRCTLRRRGRKPESGVAVSAPALPHVPTRGRGFRCGANRGSSG